MPQVTGRYIDKNAWHVVIVRKGDMINHERFLTLSDADAFADEIETGGTVVQAYAAATTVAKSRRGDLSTFNRPLKEWT